MLGKDNGDIVLSTVWDYEWYKAFMEAREFMENIPRSGPTSTPRTYSNFEKVKKIVLENCYISLMEIAYARNITHDTAAFPSKIELEQVALNMLDRSNSNPIFMQRILTGNKTWICEFDM